MDAQIRPLRPDEAPELIEAWNRSLVHDPITLETFEEKLLLDPNFEAAGCSVAVADGRVVGFVHAVVRATPYPRGFEQLVEAERETGWIVALFVVPERRRRGIGSALLAEGLDFLRERGRKRAVLGSYTPNYLLVGVDRDGYPGAFEFFERHGFAAGGETVGMAVDLQGFAVPAGVQEAAERLAADGIVARCFERRYLLPTLALLEGSFPTWVHYFLDKLARCHEPDEIVIVTQGEEVVGYCQHRYYQHVERTGPFGVRQDLRGRGIGTVMLCKLLERMAQKGYKLGWFTSTDPRTARFYERVGYRVVRRHVGMARDL
jgi:GNAT superfamily N-acetyltransferase